MEHLVNLQYCHIVQVKNNDDIPINTSTRVMLFPAGCFVFYYTKPDLRMTLCTSIHPPIQY